MLEYTNYLPIGKVTSSCLQELHQLSCRQLQCCACKCCALQISAQVFENVEEVNSRSWWWTCIGPMLQAQDSRLHGTLHHRNPQTSQRLTPNRETVAASSAVHSGNQRSGEAKTDSSRRRDREDVRSRAVRVPDQLCAVQGQLAIRHGKPTG